MLFSREVEDTAIAVLGFQTGTRATVSVTHASREPRDSFDIFGSEGSICIPVLNQGSLQVKSAVGARVENLPPAANLHLPLIEDFVDAVIEERKPRVNGETGRAVAEAIADIYRHRERELSDASRGWTRLQGPHRRGI